MNTDSITDKIGALWRRGCEVPRLLWESMVDAAADYETLVDAITAAGTHDDFLTVDLDTLDEMLDAISGAGAVALSSNRAPADGMTSAVNGQWYEGGEFMPVHGKSEAKKGAKSKPKAYKAPQVRNRFGEMVAVPEGHRAVESIVGGHPTKSHKLPAQALDYLGLTRRHTQHLAELWEEGETYLPNEVLPPSNTKQGIAPSDEWDIKAKLAEHRQKAGEAARAKDADMSRLDEGMRPKTALSGKWQKVGGSSVYVEEGRITKGCPGLKGEMVEDLIDESDDSREEREARQTHAEAKGIKGHEVTATEARKLGKVRNVSALRAAKGAAKKYNVSTRQVLQAMPDAYRHVAEQLQQREAAKERARRVTGMNAGVLARIENAHRDYSSVPNFDTAARTVASEHPELGFDPDDAAADVWELIREGREEVPDKNGPEVAEVAAQMIAAGKSRSRRRQVQQPQQQPEQSPDFDEWGDFDENESGFDDDGGDNSFDPSSFDEPEPENPRKAVIGHVSKQLKTLHKAASELNHFKNIARSNGIDPDNIIEALGGVPFSVRMAMSYSPSINSEVAAAARETERHPTEDQKKAGNYRKGRFKLWGLDIVIETPRGAVRSGVDAAGKKWAVQMPHHYGYIRRTKSEADGDHLDVFIGPDVGENTAYIVDQVGHSRFDEHKIMLGFASSEDARQAYLDSYSDGWDGLGGIVAMSRAEFLKWLETGDTSRPIAGGWR